MRATREMIPTFKEDCDTISRILDSVKMKPSANVDNIASTPLRSTSPLADQVPLTHRDQRPERNVSYVKIRREEGDDEDSSSDDEALGVVDRLDVIDDTAGCNEKETLAGMHGSQPAPGSPVVENSTQNSYPNGNEQSADATITEISASTTSDVSALGDTSETTEPAFEITGAAFTATTTCDTSTVDATVSNDHLRSPLLQVPAVPKQAKLWANRHNHLAVVVWSDMTVKLRDLIKWSDCAVGLQLVKKAVDAYAVNMTDKVLEG
ncbi:hypothetical protein JG687_00015982 [Phytophthora cactorum]|uniref:Uncharacterized protein n=1 Tax=Phytophthora cactorum TaxID=29920 RepID=A0A8T1TXA2_9STRA|nr:hypothetical protein JG687_00015982 [Phytophthora cactorum]